MSYIVEIRELVPKVLRGSHKEFAEWCDRFVLLPDSNQERILDTLRLFHNTDTTCSEEELVEILDSEGSLRIEPHEVSTDLGLALLVEWNRVVYLTCDTFMLYDSGNISEEGLITHAQFDHSDVMNIFKDMPDSDLLYCMILCNMFTLNANLSRLIDVKHVLPKQSVIDWYNACIGGMVNPAARREGNVFEKYISGENISKIPQVDMICFSNPKVPYALGYYDDSTVHVISKIVGSVIQRFTFNLPDVNFGVHIDHQISKRKFYALFEKRCYAVLPFLYFLLACAGIGINADAGYLLQHLEPIAAPSDVHLEVYDGTIASLERRF